jgi:phage replication O-like protein O
MANPQAENGHTDIANDIIDRLCSYRLSGEEWQILLVVLRKTYGWHKKQDCISLSQFVNMTGIARSSVVRAIAKLVTKRLLLSYKNVTTNVNVFEFNKDYDTWGVVTKRLLSYKKVTEVVTKKYPKVVTKLSHTKEKKETIQKKTTAFILPPDIEQDTWDAFIEMRKTMKAPLTEHAKELIITKLNVIGQDKNKVLNQSIENGWKGIFPLKNEIGGNNGHNKINRTISKGEDDPYAGLGTTIEV